MRTQLLASTRSLPSPTRGPWRHARTSRHGMPRRRRRRSRSTSVSRRSATSLRKLCHVRRRECNHRRARQRRRLAHSWTCQAPLARSRCHALVVCTRSLRSRAGHGRRRHPRLCRRTACQQFHSWHRLHGSAYDCYNAVEPAAAIGATSYAVDAVCARRSGRTFRHPRHVARQGATGSHAHGTYGTTQAASAGVGPDKRGKWLPDNALGACHSSRRRVHHVWSGHFAILARQRLARRPKALPGSHCLGAGRASRLRHGTGRRSTSRRAFLFCWKLIMGDLPGDTSAQEASADATRSTTVR